MKKLFAIAIFAALLFSCSRAPVDSETVEKPSIIKRIFVPEYAQEWNPVAKAVFWLIPGH